MPHKVLYLGTDPSNYQHIEGLVHYPIIKTIPLSIPPHLWDDFPDYTHILFTSKNGVEIFLEAFRKTAYILSQHLIAIGQGTAAKLERAGCPPQLIATNESQEGIIELLQKQDLKEAYLFYPRSSLARKKLENYLIEHHIRHQICDLYETVFQKPEPIDLTPFNEIIFTSPSTVKGFIALFGSLPLDKKLTCIGSVTKEELKKYL